MKKLQLLALTVLLGAMSYYGQISAWSLIQSTNSYGNANNEVVIVNGQVVYTSNPTIVKDAGKTETKKIDITGVKNIDASSFGNLTIEQCDVCPEILSIEADENIIPHLKHEVSGIFNEQLYLGFKNNVNIQTSTPVNFHAVIKNINKLSISGSINTTTNEIETDRLELDISGASKLNGSVKINELIADLSGSTKVTLHGNATNQKIDLSGAAKYDTTNLSSDNIHIKASGASKAWIHAIKNLKYKASGASQLFYYGNAQVKGSTSGAAKAKKA